MSNLIATTEVDADVPSSIPDSDWSFENGILSCQIPGCDWTAELPDADFEGKPPSTYVEHWENEHIEIVRKNGESG